MTSSSAPTCPQYALKSVSLHPVGTSFDVSSMMATYTGFSGSGCGLGSGKP